jgi:uncharacterized protein (TIGR00251 family)
VSVRLEARAEGVILSVRAHPGARKNGLRGEQDGALKVSVTQIAEKGKANQALLAVIAKALALRKSQVELISGETSQQKRILVRDITPEDLAARIDAALAAGGR